MTAVGPHLITRGLGSSLPITRGLGKETRTGSGKSWLVTRGLGSFLMLTRGLGENLAPIVPPTPPTPTPSSDVIRPNRRHHGGRSTDLKQTDARDRAIPPKEWSLRVTMRVPVQTSTQELKTGPLTEGATDIGVKGVRTAGRPASDIVIVVKRAKKDD